MKQELLVDKTGTLRFTPYINNRPAIASDATVILKKPGGESLQSSTSATVNATTGEITYNLTATHTDVLGENYIAEWSYTVSGTVYYYVQLFDVVLHKLAITVVDQDLLDEQSDILDLSEAYAGTVDSAANGTLVDDDLKNFDDDFFNNGKVEITNPSTGVKQVRTVSDFVQSTGTISISVNWSSNPDNTYPYVVRRSFQTKIQKAFEELMTEIRSRGFRPALIMESNELHVPLVKKTLAMICKDAIKDANDKWHELYKIYTEEFNTAMSKLKFQYDVDEDGTIAGEHEEDQDMGNLRMMR